MAVPPAAGVDVVSVCHIRSLYSDKNTKVNLTTPQFSRLDSSLAHQLTSNISRWW